MTITRAFLDLSIATSKKASNLDGPTLERLKKLDYKLPIDVSAQLSKIFVHNTTSFEGYLTFGTGLKKTPKISHDEVRDVLRRLKTSINDAPLLFTLNYSNKTVKNGCLFQYATEPSKLLNTLRECTLSDVQQ